MIKETHSQSSHPDSDTDELEVFLQTLLHPVSPNPDFVNHLGKKLVTPPRVTLENHSGLLAYVLISLGFFGGLLLLWLLLRKKR